jgi:hypothetical protein
MHPNPVLPGIGAGHTHRRPPINGFFCHGGNAGTLIHRFR